MCMSLLLACICAQCVRVHACVHVRVMSTEVIMLHAMWVLKPGNQTSILYKNSFRF